MPHSYDCIKVRFRLSLTLKEEDVADSYCLELTGNTNIESEFNLD